MTGAFLFSGGFWLVIAAVALWIGVWMWAGRRAPDEYDLWEDGADGVLRTDEQQAYAKIYDLRSFERRTENVVPLRKVGRTDKWQ